MTASSSVVADKPSGLRLRQGLLLLAGALVLELVVERTDVGFFWTPLTIGLAYLAAAAAGGRRGGYWATACGLVGWGLAVAYIGHVRPSDVDGSGAYLVGAGLGVSAGVMLARRGFDVSELGLGVTVAAGGLILALTPREDALDDARTYALALGAVGVFNVLMSVTGARAPGAGRPSP